LSADRGPTGLAAERTALAWTRTALTAAAVGATALKAGLDRDDKLDLVACGFAFAAALVLYVCGQGRRRTRGPMPSVGIPPAMRLAVFACVLAGVLVLVTTFVS
jgi:uncharacterized membrane protein YidH (DUF202 family)